MNSWSQELERYLTIRRSLGYDLRTDERIRTSAPRSSCAGRRRSATPTGPPGHDAWGSSDALPNGCTALIRSMRCHRRP